MGVTMALILGASVLVAQVAPVRPLLNVEGVITRTDVKGSTVTVKGADGVVVLQITRSTTIFAHGRTGSVEDLRPGDVVRGAYERGGGLQWIEVVE